MTWSFVVGVLSAWISTWFLLWNQPPILLPVVGFAILASLPLISGGLERVAKKQDADISKALRSGMLRRGARAPLFGRPPHAVAAAVAAGVAAGAARRARAAPRRAAPRAARVGAVVAAARPPRAVERGLVTEEEYGTKRAEIVAAL